MNLNKLFAEQQKLDEHIIKNKKLEGQNLVKKKTVALICELYELANEMRVFKFWSNDQKPRKEVYEECSFCFGTGFDRYGNGMFDHSVPCPDCYGEGKVLVNSLIEEFSDVIHFTLSIANDLGYHEHKYIKTHTKDLNDLVIGITNIATIIPQSKEKHHVHTLLNNIIQLGYQLGFTEEQVIDAYKNKNEENYARQENGY